MQAASSLAWATGSAADRVLRTVTELGCGWPYGRSRATAGQRGWRPGRQAKIERGGHRIGVKVHPASLPHVNDIRYAAGRALESWQDNRSG
jgi:hypothetical protein